VHLAAILAGSALFLSNYFFVFRSISEYLELQQEINAKLPSDKQFEPLFWSIGTYKTFRRLQQELIPDSPRPNRLWRFLLIGIAVSLSGVALVAIGLRN
jgi:hypothetical protein